MSIREYIQVRYTGIIPDSAINPEKLQIQIEVDAGQVVTLPTLNNFSYINTAAGATTSSGTLVYDYDVEWGDGEVTTGITSYNSASRTHTYVIGGTYLLQISRVFPCWDTNNDASLKGLITRVVSWGNTGLKKINFYGCSALTRLPSQSSKLTGVLTFANFCYGCSALTVIPDGTLYGVSAYDFSYCFSGCSKLKTLPETLFKDCTNAYTFVYGFSSCTKLESIPSTLFSACATVKDFYAVFKQCTTITSVPTGLFTYSNGASCRYEEIFANCTALTTINTGVFANTSATGCSFANSFYYCTSLTAVPSGIFDNIKLSSASRTFYYCTSLVTIPANLFRYQNLCVYFSETFSQCSKLTGVPSGVFDLHVGGVNSCTTMNLTFANCGTDASVSTFTIANNLFDQLDKVTSFSSTFQGCSKLEVIPTNLFINCTAALIFNQTFSGTKIASIPSGLFSTCTAATTFTATFSACTSLVSDGIPSNLFQNCTQALTFGQNDTSTSYYGYGLFYNCTNAGFTYIPAGLFDNCPNAISFHGAFYGTKITSIPTDLLRYNVAVSNVMSMFANTQITSLSANVFQYNPSITTVYGCFSGCTQLASVDVNLFNTYLSNPNAIVDYSSCFAGCTNTAFTTIPANLFQYSVNAKKFNSTFSGCNKITTIPSGLFQYNTIAEEFTSCFQSTLITTIPADLFTGLTQIKNVSSCFAFCHELLSIPATLFDSQGSVGSVNYTGCFRVSGTGTLYNKMTNAVPQLWTKPNSPIGTQCFYNRTAVSNYADIPSTWK